MSNSLSKHYTQSFKTVIQFHDIDPMGVMWHGNYPRLLETARDLVFKKFNYGYQQMVESGYMWPIVDMQIRYKGYIKLHQEVEVSATLKEFENRFLFTYTIKDSTTNELLTKATTTQVAIKVATGELLFAIPEEIIAKFKHLD